MDRVSPASAHLAIEKARTRLQCSTAEIEDKINQGRTAFVTAGIPVLRGGMPVRVDGAVAGAVTAAAALSRSPVTDQRK